MSLTNTGGGSAFVLGAPEGDGSTSAVTNVSVALGYNVAPNATGTSNTFVGYFTAVNTRSGNYNTAIGVLAGRDMGGDGNVYLGLMAGAAANTASSNTAIGTAAARSLRSGARNTLVGLGADVRTTSTTDSTAVGCGALAGATRATALGAGTAARGVDCVAIGSAVSCTGDGAFNLAGRVRGAWRSGGAVTPDTYTVAVDADELALVGGAALTFTPSSGTAPQWMGVLDGADLVFRSSNGAIVRFTDDFVPGILNHTAQHRCVWRAPDEEIADADLPGCVVIATGDHAGLDGRDDPDDVDERVPVVALATMEADPRAFGVVSSMEPRGASHRVWRLGPLRFHAPLTAPHPPRAVINAGGEGAIWVCDANGPVACGDLLTSSPIPGMAMRQRALPGLRGLAPVLNATVAKATAACDFEAAPELVHRASGARYRRARVPCVYVP